MSTMLGRPVVAPLRACCRFWTGNLLVSESGTSTGPLPLFCHLTSPDPTVRGPHRGVAPLLLTRLGSQSPAARVHPDLLCPCFCHHPRLCTLSLQSPLRPLCAMDSAQLSLQGTFLPVTASRQDEPAPKTSRGSTTPPLHPRQPCRGTSLALPLWRPQWRGGQHHSRSIQPNLIEMCSAPERKQSRPTHVWRRIKQGRLEQC